VIGYRWLIENDSVPADPRPAPRTEPNALALSFRLLPVEVEAVDRTTLA